MYEIWNDWYEAPALSPERESDMENAGDYPQSALDFVGVYLLSMLPCRVRTEDVQAILPEGLLCHDRNRREQPMIVTFGRQFGVHQPAMNIGLAMDYLEFIVAIPNVALSAATSGYRGPFVYMSRLYVDRLFPWLLGRMAGYEKSPGRIIDSPRSFRVESYTDGSPLVSGQFHSFGPEGLPAEFPEFQRMAILLRQPVISRSLLGSSLYTFLNWELDRSRMQRIKAKIEVTTDIIPALPAGKYEWNAAADGAAAWRLRVPWRDIAPFPKTVLDHMFPDNRNQ